MSISSMKRLNVGGDYVVVTVRDRRTPTEASLVEVRIATRDGMKEGRALWSRPPLEAELTGETYTDKLSILDASNLALACLGVPVDGIQVVKVIDEQRVRDRLSAEIANAAFAAVQSEEATFELQGDLSREKSAL